MILTVAGQGNRQPVKHLCQVGVLLVRPICKDLAQALLSRAHQGARGDFCPYGDPFI